MKRLFQERTFFLLVLPLAIFLRIYKLGEKQLWTDEIIQALDSSHTSLAALLHAVREEIAAAPLDFIIQHFFIHWFGSSEAALRLHAAIFGILTVVVFYYLARLFLSDHGAILASSLYAVYPLHLHYSQEGRFYALFVLLTVWAHLAFLKLLLHRKLRYWLSYSAGLVLLLYTHYYALLVISAQLLFVAALRHKHFRESFLSMPKVTVIFFLKFLISIGIPLALFLPWIFFAAKGTYGHTPEHFGWRLLFRFVKELSDGSYPLSFILLLFGILGATGWLSERKYGHLLFFLSWFFLPIPMILTLDWVRNYFFAIRQILFTTPAFFILIMVGISYVADRAGATGIFKRLKAAPLMASVIMSISLTIIFLHIPDQRDDIRSAGQFLKQNTSKEDIIIAPECVGLISYYFPEVYQYTQELSALQNISAALVPGQRLYIVKSRHMSPLSSSRVDLVCKSSLNKSNINFRGIEIIVLNKDRVRLDNATVLRP